MKSCRKESVLGGGTKKLSYYHVEITFYYHVEIQNSNNTLSLSTLVKINMIRNNNSCSEISLPVSDISIAIRKSFDGFYIHFTVTLFSIFHGTCHQNTFSYIQVRWLRLIFMDDIQVLSRLRENSEVQN